MIESFIELIPTHPIFIALLSIVLNIIVSILGVLPSTFITISTVGVLGFNMGIVVLIIGEAAGAIVTFILYRKGVHRLEKNQKMRMFESKYLHRLKHAKGTPAFLTVILLRFLPFVPSGAVTLAAALSKMKLFPFAIASTLGKIPSLYIEAYSAFQVLKLNRGLQFGLFLVILLLFLIYLISKKHSKQKNNNR